MDANMVTDALRSVRVDRYEKNGATYVTLVVSHAPGQDRVTFNIKITADAQLDHVSAIVNGTDGREKFCGFMSPVLEKPMCPVYQHI
jgi:hypothetical protein